MYYTYYYMYNYRNSYLDKHIIINKNEIHTKNGRNTKYYDEY